MRVKGRLLCSTNIFFPSCFMVTLPLALYTVLGEDAPAAERTPRPQAAGQSLDGPTVLGGGRERGQSPTHFP